MKKQVIDLKKNCIENLNNIYEFKANTVFSYQFTEESIKGKKVTLINPITNKTITENELIQELESYKNNYLVTLSFQHTINIFESWFFDLIKIILLNNPHRLNKKKKVDVELILNNNLYENIVEEIVNSEINEIKYKKPSEWFNYLNKFFNLNYPTKDEILIISEIKASRDILVHNQGIVNSIYLEKAGNISRFKENELLEITNDYFNESWQIIKEVVIGISDKIIRKM